MDTPRHRRTALDSLRSHSRRVCSSPTWWLAATSAVGVLAACSAGAPNTNNNNNGSGNNPQGSSSGGGATWDSGAGTQSVPPPSEDSGVSVGSGGAGGDAAPTPPGFDANVFATVIQPILDTAGGTGCTSAACHGSAAGQGGFALTRQPTAGSAQMTANATSVEALCNPAVPDQSLFYVQATNNHGGVVVSQTQGTEILAWIQHANGTVSTADDAGADSGGGGTTAKPGCVPVSSFNVGLFASEIQPILFGTLDYNEQPGQAVANNGCARSACHGSASNPLNISTTNTPEQNLANVACYINLTNPSSSPFLLCPLNDPGCPKTPHPGQDVFASPQDLNYERIASWLYATSGAASPMDFAFFVRQVAPIFDDPASGGIADGQRTCADTTSCHGVSAVGQIPPNLSNFPILANSSSLQGFQANYWSAANFANFFNTQGSELFLFPTNLIANTNQAYETGLPHPGGLDFSPNSTQAQAILTWVGGLQPDANGDVLNWLVAGTYDATLVSQNTEVGNDATIAPTIFDNDGAQQFNGGVWDLDSSATEFVDMNLEFPGSPGEGRVAYAVANAINTTGSDLQFTQISVTSPNAVLLYVGSESSEGSQSGNNTVDLTATIPAFSPTAPSTRILVKVLQRPNDAQFGFTLNVAQQNNQPIPAGQLIFRLDPTGGI